jgi:putative PIN family toxin of toxin-antitoxin system
MKKNNLRVIIDTNLWVSYLVSSNLKRFDNLIFSKKIDLLFSAELIDEVVEVLSRPKFRKYFSLLDIQQLLQCFDEYGELIKVKSKVNICRDAKDNFLLSLAKDGNANFLVSNDSDLLVLEKYLNTEIIDFPTFIHVI